MSFSRVDGTNRYTEFLNSAGPLNITKDTGSAANDYAIIAVSWFQDSAGSTINTPTGFTKLGGGDLLIKDYGGGFKSILTVFGRLLNGSEAANYPVSFALPVYGNAVLITFRSTNGAITMQQTLGGTPGIGVTNVVAPSVTGTSGELLVAVMGTSDPGGTWGTPSGMTAGCFNDASPSTDDVRTYFQTLGSSGATGTRTATITNSRDTLGVSIRLSEPAGAAYTTTVAQGSYSFTPQNVATSRTLSYITVAAQATYSWTAQAVGLIGAYMLASAQTSYAFTPQNVTTTYQPATNTTMVAAQASYAFTPQDAGVKALYTLPIGQSSYSWTPQDVGTGVSVTVDVYWTQVPGNEGYQIEWDIDSGAPYTYSNTVATDVTTYGIAGLLHRTTYYWRVAPLVGGYPYPWSSEGVFTTDIAPMAADYASYSWTPQNIGTYYALAYSMAVGQGAYAFTPQAVATSRTLSYSTTVAQGSYAFTPRNVATTVALAYSMAAGQGSYTFTPQAITTTVARAYSMAAADASYAFTPQVVATQTVGAYITTVEAGAYSLTLQSVGTAWSRAFATAIEFIPYAFTPQSVNTVWVQVYPSPIDQGSYSWTPQNITTTYVSLAPLMAAEAFGFAYTAMAIGSSTTGTEERSGNAWFVPFFRRMACRR